MDHADHVALIRDAVRPGETWLELGSGTGAFTLALADVLGPRGTIHSVDQDRGALKAQAAAVGAQFGAVRLDQRTADFTRPLGFSGMDGVLMANSLHFVRDKAPVLALVRSYLAPGGRFVLVEYDADGGTTGSRTRSATRRGSPSPRPPDSTARDSSAACPAGSSTRSTRASRPVERAARMS